MAKSSFEAFSQANETFLQDLQLIRGQDTRQDGVKKREKVKFQEKEKTNGGYKHNYYVSHGL